MTKNRKNKQVTASEETKVLLYTTADQQHRLEVFLEDDTAWLSQRQLADLYQVGTNTINYHISQIFKDRELEKEATIRNYRIVQSEANREVTRSVEFYNLEMILAIGYRVRSSTVACYTAIFNLSLFQIFSFYSWKDVIHKLVADFKKIIYSGNNYWINCASYSITGYDR